MKHVLLIYPRQKDVYMSTDTPYPFPIPGLTLLASFFTPQYEVKIVNEFLDEINFDEEVDLVGITALTVQARRPLRGMGRSCRSCNFSARYIGLRSPLSQSVINWGMINSASPRTTASACS